MWLIIAILIAVIILGILAVVLRYMGKEKKRPDYYSFFVMGFIWLAIGIPLQNNALMLLGAVFAVVGLANIDKWDKTKRTPWKKMKDKDKKLRIIILTVLGAFILAGIILFFLVKYNIL